MYFTILSSMGVPEKVRTISVVLILMGLLQTSMGNVGTSDSTIFYFGENTYAQNGQGNASDTDRFLDVDVSLLRSVSCGDRTTVFLFDNNTMVAKGNSPRQLEPDFPEVSSVCSLAGTMVYSLVSNASIYGQGINFYTVLWNDSDSSSEPKLSPPRLGEDIRYCTYTNCLAFDHFPPGSITDEPVIHEPNIPLYKYVGGWGDLTNGQLGMNPKPTETTSGIYYEGPDLIVKKVAMSVHYSIFILHNNTAFASGAGSITPPKGGGTPNLYLPIAYHSSINASEVKIVDASACTWHVLLLSQDHRVFFFGSNTYYASGIPGVGSAVSPTREVPFAGILDPDDYVVQIAAQYSRSSVITNMGYVYIWGTQMINDSAIIRVLDIPTLEDTFLQDRYAMRYLNQDDITKTSFDTYGSCVLTRPRAGNCTGEQPSAEYYCIGGLWTTRGGANLETLTISSPTDIDGNLTISGSLVINPQSNISVTGCLSVGSIEIRKQQGDGSPSLGIISTDKECPDISGTTVSVIPIGMVKECEKMTATLSKNETGGSFVYSAIFNINDNDCTIQNCTGMLPSTDFDCIGGIWTTREGGSSIETLTISSPTEIDGNLTISGILVINQQSSISVTGCLSIGSIEILKEQGDDSPSEGIISTGKQCPDISETTVSVIPIGKVKKCEKKTASLSKSDTGGKTVYSAIFVVNDHDCKRSNLWWIILVSVLGGVVLIVAIVILVALPLWKRKHGL